MSAAKCPNCSRSREPHWALCLDCARELIFAAWKR